MLNLKFVKYSFVSSCIFLMIAVSLMILEVVIRSWMGNPFYTPNLDLMNSFSITFLGAGFLCIMIMGALLLINFIKEN